MRTGLMVMTREQQVGNRKVNSYSGRKLLGRHNMYIQKRQSNLRHICYPYQRTRCMEVHSAATEFQTL